MVYNKYLLDQFTKGLFFGVLMIPIWVYGASVEDPANLGNAPNLKYYERLERPAEFSEFDHIHHCLVEDYAKFQRCLDSFVYLYGKDKSIPVLLKTLDRFIRTDENIAKFCHPIVHAIGRYTYARLGTIGDSFRTCDFTCQSGCFHGVMERMFFSNDQLANGISHLSYKDMQQKLPGICDKDKFKEPADGVIFQCLHGVGHAVLYSLNYKLDDALLSCDLLRTKIEQESCYGGVFMENITAFDKKQRNVEFGNPHYPCNVVQSKYQPQCYQMHTSLWLEFGMSQKEIARQCSYSTPNEKWCYLSMGRDLSTPARTGGIQLAVEACEIYSKNFAKYCIQGVVYSLIDVSLSTEFAAPFCMALRDPGHRAMCFITMNLFLKHAYGVDKEQSKFQCGTLTGSGTKSLIPGVVPPINKIGL